MLMDFWLTTFLISLHKEGGNWSIVVWHHVHTPNIKASLPDDWFRQLIAPQANAKIIYLLWGVCVCVYEAGETARQNKGTWEERKW